MKHSAAIARRLIVKVNIDARRSQKPPRRFHQGCGVENANDKAFQIRPLQCTGCLIRPIHRPENEKALTGAGLTNELERCSHDRFAAFSGLRQGLLPGRLRGESKPNARLLCSQGSTK